MQILRPSTRQTDLSHSLDKRNIVKTVRWRLRASVIQTDLGIPRTAGVINNPELVSSEEDPILSTAWGVSSGVLRNDRSGGTHKDVKIGDCCVFRISALSARLYE